MRITTVTCDQCGGIFGPVPWGGSFAGSVMLKAFERPAAEGKPSTPPRDFDFCTLACFRKWAEGVG